ncbi:MAG: Lrp/AsnC family transcriptional regulator [Proteobacteria bacterium]|nr:Lrp/AsnC family transcriptional regulator [Pseudomonadota bacterium]
MLTELEKKVIALIQGDIPVTPRPYLQLAKKIGITENEILETLCALKEKGIIRRYGATLRHQKSGYTANAMVAWQVDEERADEVGEKMATFIEVSHCYRRTPEKDWPYNLYTMIHAKSEDGCRETAKKIAQAISVTTYNLLFSKKELKKTSMAYFPFDDDDE